MPLITPNFAEQYEGYSESPAPEEIETTSPPPQAAIEQQSSPEEEARIAQLRSEYGVSDTGAIHSPAAAAATRKGTQWKQAGAPRPEAAPEMGVGDMFKEAASNIVPSAVGVGKAVYESVRHPVQTVESLGMVGEGALSQITDALGLNKDDAATKKKKQAAIQVLEDHYKNSYGSVQGAMHAFAKDPVGVMMDASTVLGGAGLVGKGLTKVGLVSKTGNLAKAGEIAAAASSTLDPVQLGLKAAKWTTNLPLSTLQKAAEKTSGLTQAEQRTAFKAGMSRNPEFRAAFQRGFQGDSVAGDWLATAEKAMQKTQDAASAKYVSRRSTLSNRPVDLSGAEASIASDYQNIAGQGAKSGHDGLDAAYKGVMDKINSVKSDPARLGMESVDRLKRQLREFAQTFPPGEARNYAQRAAGTVRDALSAHDPVYTKLMEEYQDSLRLINDARSFLGTGNRASASNALQRALKKSKTVSGKSMLEEMSQHEPTLPYLLAGAASNPVHGGVMRDLFDAAVSAGLYHINPVLAAAPILAGSPKLVGGAHYYAGRALSPAARIVEPIANVAGKAANIVGTKAPYYAGTAHEETGVDPMVEKAKGVIAGKESGGNYNAVGPEVHGGTDRAYGKYQVLGANIPEWTEKYLGKRMTPEQFLKDPGAQEKVFEAAFGEALKKYGNLKDAAAWWHSGSPLAQAIKRGAKDVLGTTTKDYADMFAASGGRIERKAGGKVEDKHERLVQRLMMLTQKAKKVEEKHTEPMLNAPDESVVKALGVAQQAI